MLPQNLILQMHDEKAECTERYTPRIWAEAGISEVIFFCPLIMAFEPLPQLLFQNWLLSVLSQGRKFGKKPVHIIHECVQTQLRYF